MTFSNYREETIQLSNTLRTMNMYELNQKLIGYFGHYTQLNTVSSSYSICIYIIVNHLTLSFFFL